MSSRPFPLSRKLLLIALAAVACGPAPRQRGPAELLPGRAESNVPISSLNGWQECFSGP